MPECAHTDFVPVLAGFAPITLEEMDGIRLMNRIDTKFVTCEAGLLRVLAAAAEAGYRVLETEGERISPYNSLYFDTADLKMFTDHHNRRLVRQKVRTRVYASSGLTFLEIKRKDNQGRTKKKRMALPPEEFGDFRTDPEACRYLAEKSDFTAETVAPVLETLFRRMTLVNPEKTERLTLDVCLCFVNHRTGREAALKDAVIIELKQDGRAESPMKRILLALRIKPFRISKYCMGVTLTDPSAKSNRFKLKVKKIEKTIQSKLW